MNDPCRQLFDFSLDALAFKEQLAKKLQQAQKESICPLEDDQLEFIHAAGTGLPPLPEDDPL